MNRKKKILISIFSELSKLEMSACPSAFVVTKALGELLMRVTKSSGCPESSSVIVITWEKIACETKRNPPRMNSFFIAWFFV